MTTFDVIAIAIMIAILASARKFVSIIEFLFFRNWRK